ncbi:MAG: glycerophosphodiester phosphodiesterase [Candidatus Kapabacteria bacterium]|jgi:glycerophosphoryl diester phosphodiesterase|nr:glycerophosphodiester phosphodiesterase [Candidatus Kapabacteria bacterium]
MKRISITWCLVLLLGSVSCVRQLDELVVPEVDVTSELAGAGRLDSVMGESAAGTYQATEGGGVFGDTVAVLWTGAGFSIVGRTNVLWCDLQAGSRSDTVVLIGRWRFTQGTANGIVRLRAVPDEGGRELAAGRNPGKKLVLRGTVTDNRDRNPRPVVLAWERRNRNRLRGFYVIGHRGGARNSDRLGVSENSLEMLRLAPRLGCNAVEIDVLLSKDGAPFVFHDARFSPRTVTGTYLLGPVNNFTAAQISTVARLIHGERIPTLQQALQTIATETPLELVWIDVKEPEAIDTVLRTIVAAQKVLAASGRAGLRILVGLPTQDIYDAYAAHPLRQQVKAICELDADQATAINAAVWAPRWTAGVQAATVQRMQGEGRQCFVWTLDDVDFIDRFIAEGDFDGILTNYPTLLAATFYPKSGPQP